VRQAKIVRLADKVDPIIGKGRSKGYGFLEMMTHADALKVLRWSNNNPEVEGLMRGWWKQELEDLLKKLQDGKKKNDEEQARIKRIKDRLKELEEEKTKKSGRTLVMEFSIENIQVVRRRSDKEKEIQQLPKEERYVKKRDKEEDEDEEEGGRPSKRPRSNKTTSKESEGDKPARDNQLGSLIGRKRREKKSKGKAH